MVDIDQLLRTEAPEEYARLAVDAASELGAKFRCGLIPVEYTVVIELDPVKEKTAGGIFIPDSVQEIDKLSAQEGTLVAASPLAFTYEKWPEGSRIPTVGDRVLFKRHAGSIHKRGEGDVKREFRLLNDKEIIAIVADQEE